MDSFKILFVDDEEINLLNFAMIFKESYEIITALSGEDGLRSFKENKDIGLVISDQRMPGINGTEMLSKMYDIDPDPIRVLLTAHTKVDYVLDAINLGRIYQYILKPWDTQELRQIIERAKALYLLKKENIVLTDKLADKNKNLIQSNEKLIELNVELERDVKRRTLLELSLRESEERFRKFTHASHDIIIIFTIAGIGIYANPALTSILGYDESDFKEHFLGNAIHPVDRKAVNRVISQLLKTNKTSPPLEIRIQKKNQNYLQVEMNFFHMDLSGGERVVGSMIRNITERKLADEKLRLSEKRLGDLSAMLITAQDVERRRLSMELHDEFGQSLAVLKLQIRAMENDLDRDRDCDKKKTIEGLQELRKFVNMQIENVRSLSRDLWPIMVDHLGVDAAFENLVTGFLDYTGIELDINMEPIGPYFPIEEQRHLYRLLQESLNNVIKHSKATNIQVIARLGGDEIILAVHDNGCGFDVEVVAKSTGKTRGIGLQAMAERMKILNGKLDINSMPGKGTSIIFTFNKKCN